MVVHLSPLSLETLDKPQNGTTTSEGITSSLYNVERRPLEVKADDHDEAPIPGMDKVIDQQRSNPNSVNVLVTEDVSPRNHEFIGEFAHDVVR